MNKLAINLSPVTKHYPETCDYGDMLQVTATLQVIRDMLTISERNF